MNRTSDTNSVSSGVPIDVATVVPVVSTNTSHVAVNAATLVINGFGFDVTAANNSVVFNNGTVGTVTAATATTLNNLLVHKSKDKNSCEHFIGKTNLIQNHLNVFGEIGIVTKHNNKYIQASLMIVEYYICLWDIKRSHGKCLLNVKIRY